MTLKFSDTRDRKISQGKHFAESANGGIFILGTNKYGLSAAEFLKRRGKRLKGFINDETDKVEFNTYPVSSSSMVPQGSIIINCIVEGRAVGAKLNIEKLKPLMQIDYFTLQIAFPEELLELDFFDNTNSIKPNLQGYEWLFNKLGDDESKITLQNIVNFRFNREISFLEVFRFRIKEQYFEPFINLKTKPSFVDGGGFDGGTSETFAKVYPGYRAIWFFEPNENSFQESAKRLKDLRNITYFKKGLWNKTETLYFDDTLGPASKLSGTGKVSIETISLDEAIKEKVDYIKLDIEGAEYNALKGSEEIIREFAPTIAVCVYHNQQDFLRIPELLLGFNPNYNIYLRHYTQGVFETVMYFF